MNKAILPLVVIAKCRIDGRKTVRERKIRRRDDGEDMGLKAQKGMTNARY
ncbi:MAG TPA: hypothetical protein VKA95_00320 [Nitrososphaeraceae archaeon]|nr:hypothetical protein [Nitrososphaeraceae archaeon]